MTTSSEPEPAVARRLFADRIDRARELAADLVQLGEPLGLIGPLEPARIWSRHLVNCVLLAPCLWAEARVADVGSGAGLPGLVLAIARPDVRFHLIEPMERRVEWLQQESRRLNLDNVTVHRARAEDLSSEFVVDQLTARAVSALSKLLPLVAPLVRPGGQLLLMKGAAADAEVSAASKVIRRLGLRNVSVDVLGAAVVDEPTRVFRALLPPSD